MDARRAVVLPLVQHGAARLLPDCGTPLTYAFDGNGRISVTIN